LTISELEGLAEAISAVEPNIPVTPLIHPEDLDADPATLEPTSKGSMDILAEVIEIVIPSAILLGHAAAGVVADRLVSAAVNWLKGIRTRKLGSGGIVEVKLILGPTGEILARVEAHPRRWEPWHRDP
jgi:hypothetical protein